MNSLLGHVVLRPGVRGAGKAQHVSVVEEEPRGFASHHGLLPPALGPLQRQPSGLKVPPLWREPLGCRGTREMWTKRTPRLTQVLAYEALASWKAAGGTAGSWGDPPSAPCPTLTPAGRAAKLPLFLAPLLVL